MQISADPQSLVQDREAVHGPMQAGILDCHFGMQREQLNQPLVPLAEFRLAVLVGEVEVADRLSPRPDRYTEK